MQKQAGSLLFRVPMTGNESLSVQLEEGEHFYPVRHYHPELQMTFILEGRGTRFIGDSVASFSENEIYLIGSNVPHVFRSDPGDRNGGSSRSRSLSLYFNPELPGRSFFSLPELKAISELLDSSSRGIRLLPETVSLLRDDLSAIHDLSGYKRLEAFLGILNRIGTSGAYEIISGSGYIRPVKDQDNHRLSEVFDYVIRHYPEDIKVAEAASVASMSTSAFCRYFRIHTRQTFTEFLNRTRTSQALKLLADSELPVSDIGYSCGYNNIPYFIRQYRKYTGFSPLAHRRQLRLWKAGP